MKKRRIIALAVTCLLAVCMCIPVYGAEPDSAGNIFDSGNMVSLPSTPFFGACLAGQQVNISNAEAKGSVMAAGQELSVDGTQIGESLYIAGNSITVSNTGIDGNVWAAGNNVSFGKGVSANGIYAVGNMVTFSGETNGFYVGGTNVTLAGTINGDAVIEGENVEITEDAVVTGKLTVRSSQEPEIDDDADINDYDYEEITEEAAEIGENAAGIGILAMFMKQVGKCLYWIVAMAAFGMLLCWLFNDHLDRALQFVKERPGAMIGTGIISWMCIPVAALLLCCSYILAPVGGMLMLAYVLLLCAGLAFAGASLVRLVLPKMNIFLSALIGIAVLEIVRMIPFIGFIAGIVADMYLLGYVILNIWDHRYKKN